LSRPALFLVHDDGTAVNKKTLELTGLAATASDFATDLLVWAYDKSDMSVRLDVETGTLDQILLDAESRSNKSASSGYNVRLGSSGYNARLRGGRDTE